MRWFIAGKKIASANMPFINLFCETASMRAIYLILVFGLVMLVGCFDDNGGNGVPDNLYAYKGVVTVAADAIPEDCIDLEDCEMFACLSLETGVPCYCMDLPPSDGIMLVTNTIVHSEEEAKELVIDYLDEFGNIDYNPDTVRAVELNVIFYNVFFEDMEGYEEVLTVGKDGTIMETMCMV